MKFGIVGLGKMGILHAAILNALPSSVVTSIAEREDTLVRFAKKLVPNVQFYRSIHDMLAEEDDLDAIYVTTPISSHRPLIEAISSSNREPGVFVEKPLAGSYADAIAIANHSTRFGDRCMVGFQKRFSPVFRRGKSLLDDGVLDELISFKSYSYVSGVFSEGTGWRQRAGQGGALLDLGSHLIDTLVWYFGRPTFVKGNTGSLYSKEVDDYASGLLEFDSGVKGDFDVSWSKEGYRLPETGIEIVGKNGKMTVNDDYLKLDLRSNALGLSAGKHLIRKPELNMSVDFLVGDAEYCLEDRYYRDCLENKNSPIPGFADGVIVNEIIGRILNESVSA
jgi:predicted dehydrogenase